MGTGMAKCLWSPGRRADERTDPSMDQWLTRLKVVNWETCIVAYVEGNTFFPHPGLTEVAGM
jgi:hypothetical protein